MTIDESLALVRTALLTVVPDKADAVADLSGDSEIAALGVDSIGLLEASAFIEDTLGAAFPDDRLARVEKVSDFMELIRDYAPHSPEPSLA